MKVKYSAGHIKVVQEKYQVKFEFSIMTSHSKIEADFVDMLYMSFQQK